MIVHARHYRAFLSVVACLVTLAAHVAFAAPPPMLNTVFPAGGQAGTSVEVTVTGSDLQGVAVVRRDARSEPESGSLMPMAK